MKANAVVISGNGINSEVETAFAIKTAGADKVDIIPIWDLLNGSTDLYPYNFLCFPGGFSSGDHLGAAKVQSLQFVYSKPKFGKPSIIKQINDLWNRNGLILGICNGFQLLVKLGLLPFNDSTQQVTLTHNLNGRFENRWVTLKVNSTSPSVFTTDLNNIELPVRHKEGRIVFKNKKIKQKIISDNLVPLFYSHPESFDFTEEYPFNPNGSPFGIASLTDPSGRIFGLMPHPEAFTHKTNHPRWTRKPHMQEKGDGLKIFENAINYLKK